MTAPAADPMQLARRVLRAQEHGRDLSRKRAAMTAKKTVPQLEGAPKPGLGILNIFAPVLHAIRKPGEVRKWLTFVVAVVGALLAEGLLPAPWDHYAAALIALAGSQGLYVVRNEKTTESE